MSFDFEDFPEPNPVNDASVDGPWVCRLAMKASLMWEGKSEKNKRATSSTTTAIITGMVLTPTLHIQPRISEYLEFFARVELVKPRNISITEIGLMINRRQSPPILTTFNLDRQLACARFNTPFQRVLQHHCPQHSHHPVPFPFPPNIYPLLFHLPL